MNILVFFTDSGTPKTGLSPTIRIRKVSDNSLVVTDAAMSEVGDGWYKYNFSTYDEEQDYAIRADGTATLNDADRYAYASNETADTGKILKINKNKWKIENNQWKVYDDDEATALYTYNLKDSSGSPSSENVYERDPV